MAVHVAILKPRYVQLILRGQKTIESRLYRSPMPPIGCAKIGERVYLKNSGGPFAAIANIVAIDEHHDLTPKRIAELASQYDDSVCGDDAYWASKSESRCACFLTLGNVETIDVGPKYVASMRAWHTLADEANVVWDYIVTDGALRNQYVRWPGVRDSSQTFKLTLPDGEAVETDLAQGKMLRWRGWGAYYETYKTKPGDRVRFVALGGGRYRVSFHGVTQ